MQSGWAKGAGHDNACPQKRGFVDVGFLQTSGQLGGNSVDYRVFSGVCETRSFRGDLCANKVDQSGEHRRWPNLNTQGVPAARLDRVLLNGQAATRAAVTMFDQKSFSQQICDDVRHSLRGQPRGARDFGPTHGTGATHGAQHKLFVVTAGALRICAKLRFQRGDHAFAYRTELEHSRKLS